MKMEIKTKERGECTEVSGWFEGREIISASNSIGGKFRLNMMATTPMTDLQISSDWILSYQQFVNVVMDMNQRVKP